MKRILTLLTGITFLSNTLLRADVTWLSGSKKVQLKEAPPAVQNAIKAQAGATQIEDLEKGTLNGRVVYEAAFKRNGKHTELRIAEDGTIVDTIVAGKSTGAQQQQPRSGGSQLAYGAGFGQKLSGAQKVSFDQVPSDVQKIIKERAGAAKIEDIDKGKLGNQTVYEVAFKKGGKHTELRISEDGKLVHEVADGKTAFWQDPNFGFTNPLTEVQGITMDQLPENIRKVVRERLGKAPLERVAQGNANGIPVYQVHYKQNNQDGFLRISQNGEFVKQVVAGQVIYESAGAQAPRLK